MKKTLSLLLILLLIFSLTACNFTTAGGIKTADGHILPPELRENAGRIWVSHCWPVDFADVETIAAVRIGDWLGESDQTSYFKATVLQRYRGAPEEEIVIVQRGTSQLICGNQDRRFTYGDELLLLLSESKDGRFKNEYTTDDFVCDVITDGDGVQYAVNRLNTADFYESDIPVENIAHTAPAKAEEVKRALEERNPALKSDQNNKRGIFRLSDLEPHLAGTAGERLYTFIPYTQGDMANFAAAAQDSPHEIPEEDIYNVTPETLTGTGMQIFKDGKSSNSYLLYGGEVFPLCVSGYPGLLSALPWDYDQNGVVDLLYSASYGISVPDPDYPDAWISQRQCYIAVFDVTKKEKINLFCTNETDTPQIDLILTETEDSDVFEIWIADLTTGEHSADLGICPLRQYGTVSSADGTPTVNVIS